MLSYQLETSIFLAVSVSISSFALYTTSSGVGNIKLPQYDNYDPQSEEDPFNVTSPNDFVDGQPIDEDVFWKEVCKRLLVMNSLVQRCLYDCR